MKTTIAMLYYVDGTSEEVTPDNGKYFTLKELQKFTDGYIQSLSLPSGEFIICNEEGNNLGLQVNEKATEIWFHAYPNADRELVGNVLICPRKMMH